MKNKICNIIPAVELWRQFQVLPCYEDSLSVYVKHFVAHQQDLQLPRAVTNIYTQKLKRLHSFRNRNCNMVGNAR